MLVVLLPIADVFKVISTVPIDFLLSSILVIVRLKYFLIFLSGGSSSWILLFNIPRPDAEAAGPILVCGLLSICFGIEETRSFKSFERIDELLSKRGVFEAFKVRENEFELFLKVKHLVLKQVIDYYNAF